MTQAAQTSPEPTGPDHPDHPDHDRVQTIRKWIERTGTRPSSNQVMAELGCGRGVAKRVLDHLDQTGGLPGPRLRSVDQPGPARPVDTGPDTSDSALDTAPGRTPGPSQSGRSTASDLGSPADRPGTDTLDTPDDTSPGTRFTGSARRPSPAHLRTTRTGRATAALTRWTTGLVHHDPQSGPQTTAPDRSADRQAGSRPPVHRVWLLALALPAFVAVWGGWVGLGGLAGFGPVHLLPGLPAPFGTWTVNLSITLPAGMEVYAVIGMRVWLSTRTRSARTRRFAAWSTCFALVLGCSGQVAYHVLARPATGAPMFITVVVACLPVAVLGMGAALFHLVGDDGRDNHASNEGE